MTPRAPTIADIEAAREQVAGRARVTPIYGSETLSRLIGRKTWLKAENLQRTGSFKVRGAVNKLSTMTEAERAAGVVAASAGNHGQAVAWAARELGAAGDGLHARGRSDGEGRGDPELRRADRAVGRGLRRGARRGAQASVERTGATFLHAFEDPAVIAGQGTIGLELADGLPGRRDLSRPDRRRRPRRRASRSRCGALRPGCRLVGVQAGKTGRGTIADGIAVKHPGTLTMSILDDLLDDIVHVEDDEIAQAIVLLLERSKLVVEGAGAASVAALLSGKAGGSGEVCALLSGGNIDATLLISVMRHALTSGRPLPRRAHLRLRPSGRPPAATRARGRRAREHRRRRAPPRGHEHPARRDRGAADDRDPRRGALRPALPRRWRRTATASSGSASVPQRRNETSRRRSPGCRPRPPARASKPLLCSSDAAIAARGPASQIVTTGRAASRLSEPARRSSRYGMFREPGMYPTSRSLASRTSISCTSPSSSRRFSSPTSTVASVSVVSAWRT